MQSLYSEKDNGQKAAYYFYSLNRTDGGFDRRYQNRHQYLEDVYNKTRNEIFDNFHNGKITEKQHNKQLTNLYAWKVKADKKNNQIRDKERAIYEKLREAYHTKYKQYI